MIRLGYNSKEEYNWKELQKGSAEYNLTVYNGKKVVIINKRLWLKTKNIIYLRKKGYDSIIMIDGKRRTGKSTVAKTIAYLLDPEININNYVAGLEEAPDKIEEAKDESVLIFDEGSLVASSKDILVKKNKQLSKIIDVVGQKKLTLIFCMPSFFDIARPIAVTHSLFLIHVYTDEKMNRGRFAYFGTKKKKTLYEIGKKNFGSYSKPKSNFTGLFIDFHLDFEEEYLKLKKESLKEAINPEYKKDKPISPVIISKIKTELVLKFKENCPEVTDKVISKGFGMSLAEFYRRKRGCKSIDK